MMICKLSTVEPAMHMHRVILGLKAGGADNAESTCCCMLCGLDPCIRFAVQLFHICLASAVEGPACADGTFLL